MFKLMKHTLPMGISTFFELKAIHPDTIAFNKAFE